MKPLSIGCAALFAAALAAGDARAEAGAPVRVYTNADLERLAPWPTQPAPLQGFDAERWEYVIQFLEREHERLNSDRNHDLAREILRAEIQAANARRRHGRRHLHQATSIYTAPAGGGPIVPLHARPSHAPLHFDQAERRVSN